jgi:hypothetical protein
VADQVQSEVIVAKDDKDVALSVEWQVRISDKRALNFTTFVRRDCPIETISKLMDKLIFSTNRVELIFELEALEVKRQVLEKQLIQVMDGHTNLNDRFRREWDEGGRRGPLRLTDAQNKLLHDSHSLQNRHRLEISALEAQIDITKGKLANAPDRAADSGAVL